MPDKILSIIKSVSVDYNRFCKIKDGGDSRLQKLCENNRLSINSGISEPESQLIIKPQETIIPQNVET